MKQSEPSPCYQEETLPLTPSQSRPLSATISSSSNLKLCLDMAEYTVQRQQKAGIEAWRYKNSKTVVFPCPSEPIWRKHSLVTPGDVAHIITMPHLNSTAQLDALIDDVIFDLSPEYGLRHVIGQN